VDALAEKQRGAGMPEGVEAEVGEHAPRCLAGEAVCPLHDDADATLTPWSAQHPAPKGNNEQGNRHE
jgi:hypothetical protein